MYEQFFFYILKRNHTVFLLWSLGKAIEKKKNIAVVSLIL